MRNLDELNINEGGDPVRGPAPSEASVRAFEARYGLTLPPDYLRLLNYSNGGRPELGAILYSDGEFSAWEINHFYELGEDELVENSLWGAMKTWRPILGDSALPFAEDGGGNPFSLDLSVSPPAVKVCSHDEDFEVVDILPSFEAFIDSLAINPDFI